MSSPTASSPSAPELPIRILLRFSGEVSTKATPTRRHFITRMRRNIKDALKDAGIPATFDRRYNRLFIDVADEAALPIISRIFGVQSLSRVETHPGESLEQIVDRGRELFAEKVRDRRFAVRARRVGERRGIPFTSNEIERSLGSALYPLAAGVDLTRPEVTVGVELYEGDVSFFTERVPVPAGLPLGTEGKALALLSGGFDSPVASWQMLRRGVSLDYLFCNMGGSAHQLDVLGVAKVLADRWSYGTYPKLHAVDFEPVMRAIQDNVEQRFWQVVLKRLMVRFADRVAREVGAIALVKGDAVGQVSSQTLQNMAVISRATTFPILRPVVGMNKEEIVELSKTVGTFEQASQVQEHCAMVARGPATAAKLEEIEAEEERLAAAGIDTLIERLVRERSIFDLRRLDLRAESTPSLEVDSLPEGALLVDLRSKAAFQGWHYPDALHLEFRQALTAYSAFDPTKTYVFYCEYEIKSAQLAELLHERGVRAHFFHGGLKGLIALARKQGIDLPEFC